MPQFLLWAASSFFALACSQQIGPTPEIHPKLKTYICTTKEGCNLRKTSVVLDYQWRNILDIHTGESCVTRSGELNRTICSTSEECAKRCALDGANYSTTGVNAAGDSVTLHLYRRLNYKLVNVQPQIYLFEEKDYASLKLLGQEISLDVDVSNLPCGLDGAAYLTEMDPSGGRSMLNPAGAAYGTGYCDSECDYNNFVNGVANVKGDRGACCNEMDLWEANSRSNQLTFHPCNLTGVYACTGDECYQGNQGPCARTGCDFNPYDLGAHHFYGHGATVDTKKPFKVVTQFITNYDGKLAEIRRLYVQNKKIIRNAPIRLGQKMFDSITSGFCEAAAPKSYLEHKHGGLARMGEALERGMVLVMGIWDDSTDNNNWLDSGSAGSCNKTEGSPANIKANHPDTSITFSNIRWGDINSTYEIWGCSEINHT